MTIHLFQDKGTALERQRLSWKDMVGKPSASSTMMPSRACAPFS